MRALLLGPLLFEAESVSETETVPKRKRKPKPHPKTAENKRLLKNLRQLAKATDLRVGVDGGLAAWKALGLTADLAVGDWDSLPGGAPRSSSVEEVITLPRAKDDSDLRAALRVALRRGASEIQCAGFSGGRPDQALGVLYDLAWAAKRARVALQAPGWSAYFLSTKSPSWRAEVKRGTTISVFALGGAVQGVTLRGFRFPLTRARLEPGTLGLSNRVEESRVQVSLSHGAAVVFVLGSGRVSKIF